jgi:hypothetical protein
LPHFSGARSSQSRPHLPEGAEGAAKQATQAEASRARKKKKAEKAERRLKREMEIARRVEMGKDHDAIQVELQLEPSTDSVSEEESEEVESEYEDDSVFVVAPHGTAATGTAQGSGTCSNTRRRGNAPSMRTQCWRRRRSGLVWNITRRDCRVHLHRW